LSRNQLNFIEIFSEESDESSGDEYTGNISKSKNDFGFEGPKKKYVEPTKEEMKQVS
jgi:hypothetical protein